MKNIIIATIILIIGILIMLKLKSQRYGYIIPSYIPLGENFDNYFERLEDKIK